MFPLNQANKASSERMHTEATMTQRTFGQDKVIGRCDATVFGALDLLDKATHRFVRRLSHGVATRMEHSRLEHES